MIIFLPERDPFFFNLPMDTCPICFEELYGKVKASPNTCDHVFCLPCIEKWAKLGSFCPVDRKRFRKIINLDSENFIQVKPSKRKRRKTVYDFSAKCEVCLKGNNASALLLCDCCDLGFHLFCLNPPLKTVPAGLWFCPTCISVESRLKKNKGITKELEADLGNGTLQLEKIKDCGVKDIDTQDKKQNSEELISKEKNVNKFSDTMTFNDEQCCSVAEACSKVASEFEGLNVEKNCSQNIVTYSLIGAKQRESERGNSSKCEKNANGRHEKEYIKCSPMQSKIHENTELLYSDDLCLNKAQKDDSLLDDCLSHSVLYGDMKIGISEEKMIESLLDKSCANMKRVHSSTCYKSLHDVGFRKIPPINPPSQPHSSKIICNENIFQQSSSSFCSFSKYGMQGNAGHGDASNINISSPCSSISAESNKGSFKHFISDVSIENCFEGPSNEIFKVKTVKGSQKEGEIQFSVFERKEGNDASQKKYSELSSKACISFSSNFNVGHCFYCKDMILAASQNYCKICKLKYMKNSIRKETNAMSTKCSHMSKKLEFSCVAGVSNKFLNFQYQDNTMEKRMSASERRQYSLLRKLQKIHKAQKKVINTQK